MNENVNNLIDNFSEYIKQFEINNPFSGPSEYFYINKIIRVTKNKDYDAVFTQEFIEWIYATLASWGMHRMGPENKGAKMNEFDSFEECIMQNKNKIIQLNNLEINKLDVKNSMDDIKDLYFSFWPLMKSNSKLVATSKVMHFLIPRLIPPMDREYTMKFFKKHLPTIKSSDDYRNINKEFEIFESVLTEISYISKKVDCTKFIDTNFSPTVPKVIDNAIVSYIKNSK